MSKQYKYKEGDIVVLKGFKADYMYSPELTLGKTYVVHADSDGLFIKDAYGDAVELKWLILGNLGEPPCILCVKHEVKKQLKKAEKKVLKLKAKLKGLS